MSSDTTDVVGVMSPLEVEAQNKVELEIMVKEDIYRGLQASLPIEYGGILDIRQSYLYYLSKETINQISISFGISIMAPYTTKLYNRLCKVNDRKSSSQIYEALAESLAELLCSYNLIGDRKSAMQKVYQSLVCSLPTQCFFSY